MESVKCSTQLLQFLMNLGLTYYCFMKFVFGSWVLTQKVHSMQRGIIELGPHRFDKFWIRLNKHIQGCNNLKEYCRRNEWPTCGILQLKFIRSEGSLGSLNSKRGSITCILKRKQRHWLLEDIKVGSHVCSRYSFLSSFSQTLGMD